MTLQDVLTRLEKTHPKNVLLFLGAGFSADLGFPLWSKLLTDLADFTAEYDQDLANLIRKRLARGQLEAAADPAFEQEVPATERAKFFLARFDRAPELRRRHKLLGALPVAAFLTTNFESTVERGVGFDSRRAPKIFNGGDRFARFNSALSVYQDMYAEHVRHAALVLKVHNDTTDPEHIVLTSKSFAALRHNPGFQQLYAALLRNCHIVFLGFSGNDDNLLLQAADLVAEYAGYGLRESYLLLPTGTKAPERVKDTPITPVFYDPHDSHVELDKFVEDLNTAWRPIAFPPEQGPRPTPTVEEDPDNSLSIFELMAVAFRHGSDERILDSVAVAMIARAASIASPHTTASAVANQLAQTFRLSPARAVELVKRYYQQPQEPPQKLSAAHSTQTAALTLSRGLRERCLAFDSSFQPSDLRLMPVVRDVIEHSLQAYGCSVALALVKGDKPRQGDLSRVVRDVLSRGRWDGVGEVEKAALSMALPDLFLTPTPEEGTVLSRLAVTATSFGLLQALPTGDIARHLTPAGIFLDTTCVLPLLTRCEPRYSAYLPLVTLSKARRIKLLFQRSFVNEVVSHHHRAAKYLRDGDLRTVGQLTDALRGSLVEYANVFLAAIIQAGLDPKENALSALDRSFPRTDVDVVAAIERIGIGVADVVSAPDDLERVKTLIVTGKHDWYERSVSARDILARNEASQLLELERRSVAGESCWFVTGDAQLRKLARERDLPGAQYVMPVSGAVGLLESLSNGAELGSAFARMLWNPNFDDQLDYRLSAEVGRLLQDGALDLTKPLAIDEARRLAAEEFRSRVRSARRAADDLEVDTSPAPLDYGRLIGESVLQIVGHMVDQQKKH